MQPHFRATQISVFKRATSHASFLCVTPHERIQQLCAQLLRAENPAVVETVAAQLHLAIQEYVRTKSSQAPTVDVTQVRAKSC